MMSRKMEKSRFIKCFCIAGLMTALASGAARAGDKPEDGKAKASEGAKPATKALCDNDWAGGFWTIAVDEKKYDGNAKNLKDYDPQHPEEAWQVLSERYFGLKDCCGNIRLHRFLGRFYDRKEADAFLRRVYKDSGLARHLNPRYPPTIIKPDALLVSDKFTCTLNKENDVLRHADWIVELDGHLFAGSRSACKQGQMKKTVTIVGCDGSKKLATDTWSAPCDGTTVNSCLYPFAPGVVAIRQDYSASGEGRQTSFRVYDLERGKQLAKFTGGGDWEAGGGSFCDFEDKDGDGIPEIVNTQCSSENDCKEVRMRKWKKDRFVDVKLKQ
jgi:hypothetical protein